MGATIFSRMAYGKDAYEAFESACEGAAVEGDPTGNLDGFTLVEVPQDVKFSTWLEAIEAGTLPPAVQMHAEEFKRQVEIYDNKHEPALCFEVIQKNPKPGLKKYLFTGWVPD